jgi:hypothetical protein
VGEIYYKGYHFALESWRRRLQLVIVGRVQAYSELVGYEHLAGPDLLLIFHRALELPGNLHRLHATAKQARERTLDQAFDERLKAGKCSQELSPRGRLRA